MFYLLTTENVLKALSVEFFLMKLANASTIQFFKRKLFLSCSPHNDLRLHQCNSPPCHRVKLTGCDDTVRHFFWTFWNIFPHYCKKCWWRRLFLSEYIRQEVMILVVPCYGDGERALFSTWPISPGLLCLFLPPLWMRRSINSMPHLLGKEEEAKTCHISSDLVVNKWTVYLCTNSIHFAALMSSDK